MMLRLRRARKLMFMGACAFLPWKGLLLFRTFLSMADLGGVSHCREVRHAPFIMRAFGRCGLLHGVRSRLLAVAHSRSMSSFFFHRSSDLTSET